MRGFWEVAFLQRDGGGPYWLAVLHAAAALPFLIVILRLSVVLNIATSYFRFYPVLGKWRIA